MNPCCGVLPFMLGLTEEEAESSEERLRKSRYGRPYWLPHALVQDTHKGSKLLQRLFRLREDDAWIGAASGSQPHDWDPLLASAVAGGETAEAPPPAAEVEAEAEPEAEGEAEAEPELEPEPELSGDVRRYASAEERLHIFVKQPSFTYFSYPFDRQVAVLRLAVAGTRVLGCDAANASQLLPQLRLPSATLEEQLLSASSDWKLLGGTGALSVARPLGDDGLPIASQCEVRIAIRRNPTSYVAKELVPGAVVVLTGLLGLWLDPLQPPLVTGRCSLLIVAMLLVVQMSQRGRR